MSDAGERLQKVLASAGLGSRREIEGWIGAGRVLVNGKVAVLGQRVGPADSISVDGRAVRAPVTRAQPVRVIVYNKPEGEICSRRDPEGRPTVFERLPRLRGSRWVIVGRLDVNTTGLLLATDSGELANRLMHPGYRIEREYVVRVNGEVDEALLGRLRTGVQLEDGPAAFDAVAERGGSGRNRWFSVVLREGRNREVRRLWEAEGCSVSRLKRVRFGPVALGPRERMGEYRELATAEVSALCACVEYVPPAAETPVEAPRSAARPRRPDAQERPQRPTRRR